MTIEWNTLSQLRAGRALRNVLLSLRECEKTQPMLARDADTDRGHVSRCVKRLTTMKLIKCLNEEVQRERFFALTPAGENYAERLTRYARYDSEKSRDSR